MKLFDSHCHLFSKTLYGKVPELIDQALESNVVGCCVIATKREDLLLIQKEIESQKIQNEKKDFQMLFSSGIHPHEAANYMPEDLNLVEEIMPHVAAIGETGLDYYYDFAPKEKQIELFRYHIELSRKSRKPFVIHCREASEDILQEIKASRIHKELEIPAVLHCSTENWEVTQKFLDLGCFISFSGILSFKKAELIQESAKKVPLERIMVETDSPYLAPAPKRGRENQPAYTKHTFDFLAQLRGAESEALSEQLLKNTYRFFNC